MDDDLLIDKTAAFIKQKFIGESTGHDWWHMYRTWQLAKVILATEPTANRVITELGALLHDIADWKFHEDEEAGPRAARQWLESMQVDESVILHIEDVIRTVSFKGAGVPSNMKTLEGKIIHDADKLDALGAIGIARAFAYGGAHNQELYNPGETPVHHQTFDDYKKDRGSTIRHFSDKLLLLADRMYTKKARQLAKHRHRYLVEYLQEFHAEWEGDR